MNQLLKHQTFFLRQDLQRRSVALTALLADFDSEQPGFENVVVAVDWSEIHSYICGSGPPRSDPLFELKTDEERVTGAHQAALSFLFEVFPNQVLVLPPHVRELMWFVETAQKYADLREVDTKLLHELHNKLDPEAVTTIGNLYKAWRKDHGKGPSDEDLSALFGKLEKGHADELQRWLKQTFAPMFLLGRWLTIDAVRELGRLLDDKSSGKRRLVFLRDYDGDLNRMLSEATADVDPWEKELKAPMSKHRELAVNDARALGYLQALNVHLHLREKKQLLFMTRSDDILSVIHRRPEWFSCLADRYSTAGTNASIVGSSPVPISRDWIYFFELGAVWTRGQDPRQELERRLGAVRAILESLPEKATQTVSARQVAHTVAEYLESDAALLNNIQALSSAQGANLKRASPRQGVQGDRSLIDFLRFVTNPDHYVAGRQRLQDDMKAAVDRVNAVLPPLRAVARLWRYRPLLKCMLGIIPPSTLAADIPAPAGPAIQSLLRQIAEEKPSAGDQAQTVRGLMGADDAPAWLLSALDAYLHQWPGKARGLVLPLGKNLTGLSQVVRHLILADYFLLEHESLRKVDEQFALLLRLPAISRASSVRLALFNLRVQLDLESSYEHGEDPTSFRRNESEPGGCLQAYSQELREEYESFKGKLEESLRRAVATSLVHACSRLTYFDQDEEYEDVQDGEFDDGEVENRRAPTSFELAVEKLNQALPLVAELERWCDEDAPEGFGAVEVASWHDAIGYHYFKQTCGCMAKRKSPAVDEASRYLKAATTHFAQAKGLLDQKDGFELRTVQAHLDLIERQAQTLGGS